MEHAIRPRVALNPGRGCAEPMNAYRIFAACAATAAVLILGIITAAVLHDGSAHAAAGPLAVVSGAVALAAGTGGLALIRGGRGTSSTPPGPAPRPNRPTPGPQEAPPLPGPAPQS
ncbi:hypothetical protein GCM10010431_10230 [Streptomyces kunmingensis]